MLLDLSLIQNYRIRNKINNKKKDDTVSIFCCSCLNMSTQGEKKSQDQLDVNDDEKHVTMT